MIKIDIDTRCWQIPKEEAFLGVESDDKVKILQFELSKNEFCNGLNFTDCNCFINYKNEGNDTIPYGITDMEVQEDGTVTFTWKVSRGATLFKGNTLAILCAKKVREDGTITNEWNSRIGSFAVSKGLEPLSSITEVPEIDIISQLLLKAQTNINQSSSLLEKAEGLGAELIDGRIGYDGKVHDNIGGAIREQVSELKGDLGELDKTLKSSEISLIRNHINDVEWERGNIDDTTGEDIGSSTVIRCSSFETFEKLAKVRVTGTLKVIIYQYDADNTFRLRNSYTITNNSQYFKFSYPIARVCLMMNGEVVDLSEANNVDFVVETPEYVHTIPNVKKNKNRALIISCNYPTYALDWIWQLNEEGFFVNITTWEKFTNNVDDFINEFEILLFGSMSNIIPYDANVSTREVVDALVKWKKSGNKYIYLTENTQFKIIKNNIDGTEAESTSYYGSDWYSVDDAICDMYNTSYTGNESYSFVDEENKDLVTYNRKPVGNGRKWNSLKTGLRTLISYSDGNSKYPLVIMRDGKHAFICNTGNVSGDYDISGYFVYAHIGKIARLLTSAVPKTRFAIDCMNGKKIVASGIDGDNTTEPLTMDTIKKSWNGKPCEISLVADKMTDELADRYKALGVELNSHSSTHYTSDLLMAEEEYTVGSSQIVKLNHTCRITISYVKKADDSLTFSEVAFTDAVSSNQYGYDDHSSLKFHSSIVGQTIKVRYSYLKENDEWLGSIKKLEDLGAITNRSVFLTAGYKSVSGATYAYAENTGVTLCDHHHTNENKRNDYLINEYPKKSMIPMLQDFIKGTTFMSDCGIDYYIKNYSKANAKTQFASDLVTIIKRHRPVVFYSHDFWFSETANNSVWVHDYGHDWKQNTYLETVEYVSDFFEWYINTLNNEDVTWLTRSDWVRRYNYITKSILYDVQYMDGKTTIIAKNVGTKTIKGVTFRTNLGINNVSTYPKFDYVTSEINGERLISFDLGVGETKVINIYQYD